MEKGIESEENNLYKQTEDVADNVLDSLNGVDPKIKLSTNTSRNNSFEMRIDYNKITDAFLNALNKCKLTLDEDGFVRLVRKELYEVI